MIKTRDALVSSDQLPDFSQQTVTLYYCTGAGTDVVSLKRPSWVVYACMYWLVGELVAPNASGIEAGVEWGRVIRFHCHPG